MKRSEAIKSYFSRLAEEDMKEDTNKDRAMSIVIVVLGILIMLYFILHQIRSTNFFTAIFGTVEIVMLYGPLIFWIFTSTNIVIRTQKPFTEY